MGEKVAKEVIFILLIISQVHIVACRMASFAS